MTLGSCAKEKRQGPQGRARVQQAHTQSYTTYKLGTTITKLFHSESYMRRITNYDPQYGYYTIEYSDGDGEEMTHATVTKHLQKKY